MAALGTVDLKVRDKKGNNVSELIKMFESRPDDLATKCRRINVVVSDGGRYAPRDVTGTWMLIQSCGNGSQRPKKGDKLGKTKPKKGFVKKFIDMFGRLSAGGGDHWPVKTK